MTVSKEDLINAELDVETIEAVVNGAADAPPVVSRLGRSIKTLARVEAESLAAAAEAAADMTYNKATIIPTTAVFGSPGTLDLTMKAGYDYSADGEKLFSFIAPATNLNLGELFLRVLPAFDHVPFYLGNGQRILPFSLIAGQLYVVRYDPATPKVVLVTPQPELVTAHPCSAVSANGWTHTLTRLPGFRWESSEQAFSFLATSDRWDGEYGGFTVAIADFVDGRQVEYPDGSPVGNFAWHKGDRICVTFCLEPTSPSFAQFIMTSPPPPPASSEAVSSYRQFYAEANSQTFALAALGQ